MYMKSSEIAFLTIYNNNLSESAKLLLIGLSIVHTSGKFPPKKAMIKAMNLDEERFKYALQELIDKRLLLKVGFGVEKTKFKINLPGLKEMHNIKIDAPVMPLIVEMEQHKLPKMIVDKPLTKWEPWDLKTYFDAKAGALLGAQDYKYYSSSRENKVSDIFYYLHRKYGAENVKKMMDFLCQNYNKKRWILKPETLKDKEEEIVVAAEVGKPV